MTPRAQLLIAVLAAFLFGLSAGSLAGFALSSVLQGRTFIEAGRFRGAGPRGEGFRARLEDRLDLSAEQRRRVRAIVEGSRSRYAAMRESTRSAIEAELTPAQRERWRDLDERFRRHRGPRDGRWRQDRP
jgi:Spy/CpxP family protein refolding chaperone